MREICYFTGVWVVTMVLLACTHRMSADELASEVKTEITQKLANDSTLDVFNDLIGQLVSSEALRMDVEVKDVQLVHEEGNKYAGFLVAKVQVGGFSATYRYPLDVVYDGENLIWNIDNGGKSLENLNIDKLWH